MDRRVAKFGEEIASMAKENMQELKENIKKTANQNLIEIFKGREEIENVNNGVIELGER